MTKDFVDQCGCDTCCKEDMPIVAAGGMLFRCCLKGQSYIPTEMIEHGDLIEALENRINSNTVRRRANSTPAFSKQEQDGKVPFEYDDYLSERSISGSFSDSHPARLRMSRLRERLSSQSEHRSPAPAYKTMPQSVLVKCCDRKSSESLCSFEDSQENSSLLKRFTDKLAWVEGNVKDFVALENLSSTLEVSALLLALAESKTTTVLQIIVNSNDIAVMYQFVDNFKHDFMMLKVGNDYCMFMAPF